MLGHLRIHPNEPIRHQIIDDGLRARPLPVQIQLQHGDAHVAEDLDCFENRSLVGIELFGDRADVLFWADAEDGEARAEGGEGFNSAEDVVSIIDQGF